MIKSSEKLFYTGCFSNKDTSTVVDSQLLSEQYPFLIDYTKAITDPAITIGAAMWKFDLSENINDSFDKRAFVFRLLQSKTLAKAKNWKIHFDKFTTKNLEKFNVIRNSKLDTFFEELLYYRQTKRGQKSSLTKKICKQKAIEFLDDVVGKKREEISFLRVDFGWSNWFANNSHYDFSYLLIQDTTLYILSFSEST